MIEHLAWPGAVVLLGTGFMLMFRTPVARLVDRITKVSKGGVETGEPQHVLQRPTGKEAIAEFMASFDNPLLREQENLIRADLKQRGLTEPEAAETALVRALALSQVTLHFERVQSLIWASQVAALTFLNSSNNQPLAEIERFYEAGRARDPSFYVSYSYEQWLEFLRAAMLLVVEGEQCSISLLGREFLKWRIENGRAGPFGG